MQLPVLVKFLEPYVHLVLVGFMVGKQADEIQVNSKILKFAVD